MTRTMKILGYTYKVIQEGDDDMIGSFGRHHPKGQVIQIAEGLSPDQTISTVLHEIIEALNYCMELGLEHSAKMSLESGLYQVLTDNGVDLSPLWPTEPCVLKLMREQYE